MVAEVLGHHDVVASVLCVEIATEAVIEYLIRRKQVCKDWYAHISLLLKNAKWLAPFVRSAHRFVHSIASRQSELRALGNGNGAAIALAKSGIIAKYVGEMHLHMFDENSQLRALCVLQLILKSKTLRDQNFMSIVTVLNKVMDKHVSAGKVQTVACAVIRHLAQKIFYREAFLATGTIRKVVFFMRQQGESRSVPSTCNCTIPHTFVLHIRDRVFFRHTHMHAMTFFCMVRTHTTQHNTHQ